MKYRLCQNFEQILIWTRLQGTTPTPYFSRSLVCIKDRAMSCLCLTSFAEPNGGVLCACLPCLAPLFTMRKKKPSYERAIKQGSDDSHRLGSGKKTSPNDYNEPRSEAGLKQSSYIPLDDWESREGRNDTTVATQREQFEVHGI